MRNLSWLGLVLVVGCGGETSAGGQYGGSGGAGGAGQAGAGPAGQAGAAGAGASGASGGGAGGGQGGAGAAQGGGGGAQGGQAGNICGTIAGLVCGPDEFCDFPDDVDMCGAADGAGFCVKRPSCSPTPCFDPTVCGCDGQRYCSECEAKAAGTDVAACPKATCGGEAGGKCADDEFCDFPDSPASSACGGDDTTGVCAKRPKSVGPSPGCTADPAQWVCGCDGKSYCSVDDAHGAGVDVARLTPCGDKKTCGGLAGFTCGPDEFCDFPDDQCTTDDGTGVCEKRPAGCDDGPCSPVCDCAGTMYCSACDAQAQGIDPVPCPP